MQTWILNENKLCNVYCCSVCVFIYGLIEILKPVFEQVVWYPQLQLQET